jgi:hypothetical protein
MGSTWKDYVRSVLPRMMGYCHMRMVRFVPISGVSPKPLLADLERPRSPSRFSSHLAAHFPTFRPRTRILTQDVSFPIKECKM